MRRVQVIDSHTAGEPTRVVIEGGPPLGDGPLAERREAFARLHAGFRRGVTCEPRGFEAVVGALLVPPVDASCCAGVIFFDNAGALGMCGHGTIGVAVTLAHLGRIGPGTHRLETPVGIVPFTLEGGGRVSFENVPSYRHAAGVEVAGHRGDVAWGGNWFFLTGAGHDELTRESLRALTARASGILAEIRRQAKDLALPPIDHVELHGPPADSRNHGRGFVLCPSGTYDRSPCGTGTSARLACLAAEGALAPGERWRQEGALGTVFEARYRWADEGRTRILPTITGEAYITGEGALLFDPRDPFREGIGA
jgi:proline racemase